MGISVIYWVTLIEKKEAGSPYVFVLISSLWDKGFLSALFPPVVLF